MNILSMKGPKMGPCGTPDLATYKKKKVPKIGAEDGSETNCHNQNESKDCKLTKTQKKMMMMQAYEEVNKIMQIDL
jgi:hypothetical protein